MIGYTVDQCAVVVLAAGESSRMGSPKQLLVYKGKSMLEHSADTALQTGMWPVVIVTGVHSNSMKKQMEGRKIEIAENKEWQEGMASSLRCGLVAAQKIRPGTNGIIFMVCDQPYVTKSLLECLLQVQHETTLPIVASCYEDILGIPALFHQSLFAELLRLKGDTGARKLIKQYEDLVARVPFPDGIIDIDTRSDYEGLSR